GGHLRDGQDRELAKSQVTKAAKDIRIRGIPQSEIAGYNVAVAASGRRCTVRKCLTIARAPNHSGPINAVALLRVRRNFNQAGFDHYLLGWLVDRHQQFADVVQVAASFPEETGVGPLVELKRILARELRGQQRRYLFCPRITELIIVALGWLRSLFGRRLNIINMVNL